MLSSVTHVRQKQAPTKAKSSHQCSSFQILGFDWTISVPGSRKGILTHLRREMYVEIVHNISVHFNFRNGFWRLKCTKRLVYKKYVEGCLEWSSKKELSRKELKLWALTSQNSWQRKGENTMRGKKWNWSHVGLYSSQWYISTVKTSRCTSKRTRNHRVCLSVVRTKITQSRWKTKKKEKKGSETGRPIRFHSTYNFTDTFGTFRLFRTQQKQWKLTKKLCEKTP